MSQFSFDMSTTGSGFIKRTFEKITQETTAPQIISFHRTPQRKKLKHRTPQDLRSPQIETLFTASPHQKTSPPQHRKSPCPPPLIHTRLFTSHTKKKLYISFLSVPVTYFLLLFNTLLLHGTVYIYKRLSSSTEPRTSRFIAILTKLESFVIPKGSLRYALVRIGTQAWRF